MSIRAVAESVQNCKLNANKLRAMASSCGNPEVEKILMIAAHHLDVAVAELDYILTSATVST